ncbi:MAG: hypothetical protein J6F30_11100 [Cellulosilyticum sp.]|nr:hypothetical protein [Cellulosilyticum sp.]
MHKKLKEVIDLVPLIQKMTGRDAAICVMNRDRVVEAYFKAQNIGLSFEVGYTMDDPDHKLDEVIRTGKQAYNKVPKEVFGVAFEGTITPIFDGREVVGLIVYTFSTEDKEEIINNANGLSNSITQTGAYIQQITAGARTLALEMKQVQEITDMVRKQIEEANSVVDQIQKNANYSNILALNASIESARAGQAGRGFAVVSDEMGKFSKMSGEAATKINQNLAEIIKSLNQVKNSIDQSANIVEEQAKATSELNEKFEEVTQISHKVTNICKQGQSI